jgi:hypothetical protein
MTSRSFLTWDESVRQGARRAVAVGAVALPEDAVSDHVMKALT